MMHFLLDVVFCVGHQGLLSMMDILLIVLTLLQLCVSISTTILGIQALTRPQDYDQVKQKRASDNIRFLPYSQTTIQRTVGLPYSQTTHCISTLVGQTTITSIQSGNTLLLRYCTVRQHTVTIIQSDNTLLLPYSQTTDCKPTIVRPNIVYYFKL